LSVFGRLGVVLGAGALIVAAAAAQEFRPGPSMLTGGAPPGAPVATATWEEVRSRQWSTGSLPAVEKALRRAGGVLFVGRTDPVGPRALNDSLGLQYAVRAAHLVHRALGGEPWRLACASAGESVSPGVDVFPWTPPSPALHDPSEVLILDPVPNLPRGRRLWALWRPGASLAGWSADEGPVPSPWEAVAGRSQVLAPLPGRAAALSVGIQDPKKAPEVAEVGIVAAREEPSLTLDVEAGEAWWARVLPSVPKGTREATVWSSGIPYPVTLRDGRAAEVSVALFPGANRAYLEVLDAAGKTLVGPEVMLPEGRRGEPPTLLVLVVWEGDQVDLDLHAWAGSRHTHPQDPDPAFSHRAVPGTRLLFDGSGDGRASALAVWGTDDLELEVWCYSDLTGRGGRAWVYRIDHPGDPLASRRRLYGPRRMSEVPLEVRWPLPGRSRPDSTP